MRSFVAIDFETATPGRHTPCAIGIVKVVDGVILQRVFSLIRPPENEYSRHNIEVHGITPDHSEYAPEFFDFYPTIKTMINFNNVVCHQASFDIDVLYKSMRYHGINERDLEISVYDTYEIYGKALDVCCSECGIDLHHHDCLSDAEACARLFMQYNNISIAEIKPKTRMQKKNFEFHEKLEGDILKPDFESVSNKNNPFFAKKVVITGTYKNWPDKNNLARLIKSFGADINGTVSRSTQILIAGANAGPVKLADMAYNISLDSSRLILTENKLIEILRELNTNS